MLRSCGTVSAAKWTLLKIVFFVGALVSVVARCLLLESFLSGFVDALEDIKLLAFVSDVLAMRRGFKLTSDTVFSLRLITSM